MPRTPAPTVSNAGLVVFRALFGALMAAESFGALATGWVRVNLVEPELRFPILGAALGYDWLAWLGGPRMYAYFAAMGVAALGVALGYRYRLSAAALALLWTGAYLAQTSSYNNHYYLAVLLCWAIVPMPAHRRAALDVRRTGRREVRCAAWIPAFFAWQLWIVFTFAAVAKLYPGWWGGEFIATLFASKAEHPLLGPLLASEAFQRFIVAGAIAFDALVVPALAWRRTRAAAFAGLVAFNLFNSVVLEIGVFPYLVLALAVFFFEPRAVERAFRALPGLGKSEDAGAEPRHAPFAARLPAWLALYFAVQLALPLRHHLFPGDVNWTDEGHRMSWRMMLRTKSGAVALEARDAATGRVEAIDLAEHLSPKQRNQVATRPECLHQFVRYWLDRRAGRDGARYEVRARESLVSLNGTAPARLYSAGADLATARWSEFARSPWVLDRAPAAPRARAE